MQEAAKECCNAGGGGNVARIYGPEARHVLADTRRGEAGRIGGAAGPFASLPPPTDPAMRALVQAGFPDALPTDLSAPAGLFLAAFLGATLVPVSSEAAFVAALRLGMDPALALAAASAGNALGAALTYGMGWALGPKMHAKLERSRSGRRALAWAERYGALSLAGAWLPVVGDPICLAAGLFRMSPWAFVLLGIGTRVARYAVLLWAFGA